MAYFPSYKLAITLAILLLSLSSFSAYKENPSNSNNLSPDFYLNSCPNLLDIVRSAVETEIQKERRMGASLLRLHFHDCFVNGCDGSVLLDDDDSSSLRGEKTAAPNNNSARGFEAIDKIKFKVEQQCKGIVSCADILAIAARDSVCQLGGPSWKVKLGRNDSRTANFTAANTGAIPPPTSGLANLTARFKQLGLSNKDLVALSGAHTIGLARCTSFRARIYNDANINQTFANERKVNCSSPSGSGDDNLAPLDRITPTDFDNYYYQNLVGQNGLLHSDQELLNGRSTESTVKNYAKNQNQFYNDFATAMVKMGDLGPPVGIKGEVRKNCRKPN